MHVDEVKRYYEQNTRRFLTLGQGGAEGAIHRAVWGEGVEDRREAFHFVHELVLREARTLQSPLRALDLGCGVGASLLYLAERLSIEGIGITLSPLQVELARNRVATHPAASSVEFECSGSNLSFRLNHEAARRSFPFEQPDPRRTLRRRHQPHSGVRSC